MRFGEPGACDDSADLHLPMRGNDEQSLLRQTYYCSVHCGVAVYVPTVHALAVLPDIMGQAVLLHVGSSSSRQEGRRVAVDTNNTMRTTYYTPCVLITHACEHVIVVSSLMCTYVDDVDAESTRLVDSQPRTRSCCVARKMCSGFLNMQGGRLRGSPDTHARFERLSAPVSVCDPLPSGDVRIVAVVSPTDAVARMGRRYR